jgi:hypothetical protein
MCEGGEGGIREWRRRRKGIHFSCIGRGGENWGVLGDRVNLTVGFTVHRG